MSAQKRRGKSSGSKSKSATKKSSLPAFGFGEDLLKGKKSAAPAGDEAPAAAETTADSKISLPAFGFAEDLLKKVKGAQGAEESPARGAQESPAADAESPPGEERPDTAGTEDEVPAVEEAVTPPGEERIFRFADSLEAAGDDQEQAAPVRLETWVTFDLGGETFALPVEPVLEIVRPTGVTRVPHAPHPIRGVTNLRGRVVPVIDLRLRLELPENDITRSSRIVVVGSRGRRLGLLVDAVRQVVHLEVDRIQPPPDDVMTVQSDYISGVYHLDGDLILLLNVDRVLIIKEPVSPGPSPAIAGEASQGAA